LKIKLNQFWEKKTKSEDNIKINKDKDDIEFFPILPILANVGAGIIGGALKKSSAVRKVGHVVRRVSQSPVGRNVVGKVVSTAADIVGKVGGPVGSVLSNVVGGVLGSIF